MSYQVWHLTWPLKNKGVWKTEKASRAAIPQWLEPKPPHRKLTRRKKVEGSVPDKEASYNSRITTKWSGDRQSPRKRIQNNDSKDDPGSWKRNGGKDEGARNVQQRSRRTKKQTRVNNTVSEMTAILKGINSRITEAEDWISNLEDRVVEITAAEQNKEKQQQQKMTIGATLNTQMTFGATLNAQMFAF